MWPIFYLTDFYWIDFENEFGFTFNLRIRKYESISELKETMENKDNIPYNEQH